MDLRGSQTYQMTYSVHFEFFVRLFGGQPCISIFFEISKSNPHREFRSSRGVANDYLFESGGRKEEKKSCSSA